MFITHSETSNIQERAKRLLIEQGKFAEFKKFLRRNSFRKNIVTLLCNSVINYEDVDKIMKYTDNCPNSFEMIRNIVSYRTLKKYGFLLRKNLHRHYGPLQS